MITSVRLKSDHAADQAAVLTNSRPGPRWSERDSRGCVFSDVPQIKRSQRAAVLGEEPRSQGRMCWHRPEYGHPNSIRGNGRDKWGITCPPYLRLKTKEKVVESIVAHCEDMAGNWPRRIFKNAKLRTATTTATDANGVTISSTRLKAEPVVTEGKRLTPFYKGQKI